MSASSAAEHNDPSRPVYGYDGGNHFDRVHAAMKDALKRAEWAGQQIADVLLDTGHVEPWYLDNYRKVRASARYADAVYQPEAEPVRARAAALRSA